MFDRSFACAERTERNVTLPPTPHEPPDDDTGPDELVDGSVGGTRRAGRHRRPYRPTWPRLAERILGGWAPTLRMATLLVIILAAGVLCVLAVWGAFGVACVIILCAILQRVVSRLNQPLQI